MSYVWKQTRQNSLNKQERQVLKLIENTPVTTKMTSKYIKERVGYDPQATLDSLELLRLIEYRNGEWELRGL